MKTVGVIGLGIIGKIWADHYARAGVLAGTWNRTPRPESPKWLATPDAVAAAADAVHIVVSDPAAVEDVLRQIAPVLGPGKAVIQSSTIDPDSSDNFHRLVDARGAHYVEAPFTGSKPAAEAAKVIYYVGGDAASLAAVDPLLALLSEVRLPIGTHRQAAAVKLAMNVNIAAQIQGLAEALTIARRAGVDDDVFFSALARNASYSGVAKLKEPKLRARDYTPQFSIKHFLKDLRLASRTAGGESLPVLTTVRGIMQTAAGAGLADEDYSAIIQLLERTH